MDENRAFLKQILTITNINDMPEIEEGMLILSDSQAVLDYCKRQKIPVAGFEHDDISGLHCDNILINVDDVDDYVFENIYRRCKGIPLNLAETRRTVIREFSMEDLDALFELYSQPQITEFIEPLYGYEEEREYEQNYIDFIYKMCGFGMWLVFDKESGELLGRAGIEKRDTCKADNQAELGFCISPKHWGQGIGFEVCTEILRLAREDFEMESLVARCQDENIKSKGLLKKLGFELTERFEDRDRIYYLKL